ncbi:LysR substrate-binding domain-containing protein [Vineibacter terrae]|uniref:LysR substrate-binding domain-containing protein n=1 Tax=Vineibacter terrae TaxID=2586908 RepID=UPI002E2F0F57|nr:LysR substrate-binding domain-containing protein [Vineibacter terrae]HEX2889978.1 LysR substrate-binding domain-containing protein [Vineibacter terrae]
MAERPAAAPGSRGRKIKYINLNQLRSFFAVAEHRSFTRAARSLNVGQPTITTQVRALEERYGVELFQRLPGKIALSETGAALLAIVRPLFELEAQAVTLMEARGGAVVGTLRVGSVGPFFVMKLLAAVQGAHPTLTISLKTSNSEEILREVLDGKLDVAVVGDVGPDSRLSAVPLQRQSIVVFVGRRHRWSRRQQIDLRELHGQPMVMREQGSRTREALERVLAKAKIKPRIVMEVPREAVREAVAEGLGIGILSEAELTPDPRFKALRIADSEAATEAFAICLQSRRSIRSIAAFMDIATQVSTKR